jgi:hypothetical protein
VEPLEDRVLLSLSPSLSGGSTSPEQGTASAVSAARIEPGADAGAGASAAQAYGQPASSASTESGSPAGPGAAASDTTPGDDGGGAEAYEKYPPSVPGAQGTGTVYYSSSLAASPAYPAPAAAGYAAAAYRASREAREGAEGKDEMAEYADNRPAVDASLARQLVTMTTERARGPVHQPTPEAEQARAAPAPPAPVDVGKPTPEPAPVPSPRQGPAPDSDQAALPALSWSAPESAPGEELEAHPNTPAEAVAELPLFLPTDRLLVGPLPSDLPALQRAAEEFFARLEALADDVAASPASPGLAPLLVVATVAAGAIEFARRRAFRPEGRWAPSPVFAVLPPEDES